MTTAPVRYYHRPRFPTRDVLDAHPEFLRLVPRRWEGSPVVLAGLAAACAIVSVRWSRAGAEQQTPAASHVAPIFVHGEGWGSFGCVAVNPPVLLSEEDARAAIVQEAKAAGLTLTAPGPTLAEVTVAGLGRDDAGRLKRVRVPLTLDLGDKARSIAFEYVTGGEARTWDIAAGDGLNTLQTARALKWRMEAARPAGAYAVLYDPMVGRQIAGHVTTDPATGKTVVDTQAIEREAGEKAKAELRAQVRDFIAWLKAQGVL